MTNIGGPLRMFADDGAYANSTWFGELKRDGQGRQADRQ
jgi:hypothetical protein